MPTNTQYVMMRLGADTAGLSQALSSAGTMIGAWVDGIGKNMVRRIRAYTERLIAVTLVITFLRSIREQLNEIEELKGRALSLRIDPGSFMALRDFANAIGVTSEQLETMIQKLNQGTEQITPFISRLRDVLAEIEKLPEQDRTAAFLQKTGLLLTREQLAALRAFAVGGNVSNIPLTPSTAIRAFSSWLAVRGDILRARMLGQPLSVEHLAALAADEAMRARERAQRYPYPGFFQMPAQGTSPLDWYREFLAAMERLSGETVKRAIQMEEAERRRKQAEKQEREIEDALERYLEALKNRFMVEEKYSEAIHALVSKRAMLERQLATAKSMTPDVLIKTKTELLQVDTEIASVLKEWRDKIKRQQEERLKLESEFNEKAQRLVERYADIQFDIQQRKEAFRQRFYPTDEMLAQTVGSPVRRQAMFMRWLERLGPWLRARGMFQMASMAEQRALSIREWLESMGFLAPQLGMQKLNRDAEEIRKKFDALVQEAKTRGIKINPQLAN